MSRATWVFDGDCGFCTWVVEGVKRWLCPDADVVPWQFADLAALGLTAEACAESMQWVAADGRVSAGGAALTALLRNSRQPWPVAGAVTGVPGIAAIVDLLYRLVARYRYRLPGSTPACARPRVATAA